MLRKLLAVVSIVWAVQLSAYWLAASFASLDGHFPSPQPDTKLYCQSARRIVEGHPFSFSEGEDVSTGTTSVLHPFVLAVPYACGAKGDRLLVAGFFLNGLFYLIFLLGWTAVIARCVNGCKDRYLSVILIALAAQPALCAFGQTDTGLWMAVSAAFVAAIAWNRWWLAVVLMLICPWVRPEGVILTVALALAMLLYRPMRRRSWMVVGGGLLSTVLVFAFNWFLTGRCQFDSVAHKGYFKVLPMPDAVGSTLRDGMEILRTFFVGTTDKWPASIYFLPVVGGVFLALGILSRRWRRIESFPVAVMGIATLGSMAIVASSGWQGTNFDRYLAWTMPVFLLLTAKGAVQMGRMAAFRRLRYLPTVVCVGFYCVMAVGGVMMFHSTSKLNASHDEFQRACELTMASGDLAANRSPSGSVGGIVCADAYDYSRRRYRHLAGLYSPDFFRYYKIPFALELLKRKKDLRFDYWDLKGGELSCLPGQRDEVLGAVILSGPYGRELREADWRAFDAGEAVPTPLGKRLVARLDVGYLPDEEAAEYEVIDRWGREPSDVFFAVAPLGGRLAVDAGRSILGGDMFTVPLVPGRDCEVTIRTLARHGADEMRSPVKMLLNVNGHDVKQVMYELNVTTNAFQDVTFRIPGTAIAESPCRIGLFGDHITCGYWFWQE